MHMTFDRKECNVVGMLHRGLASCCDVRAGSKTKADKIPINYFCHVIRNILIVNHLRIYRNF